MTSATCSCCGAPADDHHPNYADDAGWFCVDCYPRPRGQAVRVVNAWQAATAWHGAASDAPLTRRAVVIPIGRGRLRGAA